MIFFDCCGLNFNNVLKKLKENNIEIFNLKKKSYKEFEVSVLKKDCNLFLQLLKKNNIKVERKNKTFLSKFIFGIKTNLAIFICFLICTLSFCFFSNFVYKIEVNGLNKISVGQVEEVLNSNGFCVGKPKWCYDFEKIELALLNNIESVSLASVSVFGNTLIINIHEKIDWK